MGFGFKQLLVGEKRCVTTLITAAEETMSEKDSCTCKLRLEALARSDIWYLFGQGNITCNFIRVKSGNFEK